MQRAADNWQFFYCEMPVFVEVTEYMIQPFIYTSKILKSLGEREICLQNIFCWTVAAGSLCD